MNYNPNGDCIEDQFFKLTDQIAGYFILGDRKNIQNLSNLSYDPKNIIIFDKYKQQFKHFNNADMTTACIFKRGNATPKGLKACFFEGEIIRYYNDLWLFEARLAQ